MTIFMENKLTKKENLLHHLIFDDDAEFCIDIEDYVDAPFRAEFREEIRNAILKAGKKILNDKIINTEEKIIWKISLK